MARHEHEARGWGVRTGQSTSSRCLNSRKKKQSTGGSWWEVVLEPKGMRFRVTGWLCLGQWGPIWWHHCDSSGAGDTGMVPHPQGVAGSGLGSPW